jgi:hypothetical protein
MRRNKRSHFYQGIYDNIKGGFVKPTPLNSRLIKDIVDDKDNVKTLIQVGELVIPYPYVNTVTKFLRKKKIHFGNFK